jgi:hypothetical protein
MQQFHRVERYLKRMRRIYAGVPHVAKDPKEYEDDVASFFVHCHHLADWVTDHYASVTTKQEVQAFVYAHPELQLCADICNASKHCKLQRVRTGSQPSLRGKDWMIVTYKQELRKPVTFFGKYRVHSGSSTIDALELAEIAFALWRDFNRKLALRKV